MDNLNINLNLYRSFYYVAKYGGFTKASIQTLLSQSSLSSNIKNLEKILGKKLFDRNISKVLLTSDGKELYLKLEEIVNILSGTIEKKEINIGSIRFIADNYLDKVILNFKERYKNIKINFNFANTTDLFQMLKKDELDLIITRYPLFYKFENYINLEKIIDVENVFVCSKQYYEQEKYKMNNLDYTFSFVLPNSSEKRRNIEQYLLENNINYEIIIELPNSNLLKKLLLDGVGIGYINKKFVENEVDNGDLVIINKFKNIPLDNVTVIYNSKKDNPITKGFIKILKDTMKKNN